MVNKELNNTTYTKSQELEAPITWTKNQDTKGTTDALSVSSIIAENKANTKAIVTAISTGYKPTFFMDKFLTLKHLPTLLSQEGAINPYTIKDYLRMNECGTIPQVSSIPKNTVVLATSDVMLHILGKSHPFVEELEGKRCLLFSYREVLYLKVLQEDNTPYLFNGEHYVLACYWGTKITDESSVQYKEKVTEENSGEAIEITFDDDIRNRRVFRLADDKVFDTHSNQELATRLDVVLRELFNHEFLGHRRTNRFNYFIQLGNRHFVYTKGGI